MMPLTEQPDWVFARSLVEEDPAKVSRTLKGVVARLESACLGLVNFPREFRDDAPRVARSDRVKYRKFKDATWASFEVDFVRCPLQLFHLPNGTQPYVVDTSVGTGNACGTTLFESLAEPAVSQVWQVIQEREITCWLNGTWTDAEMNAWITCSVPYRRGNDIEPSLTVELRVNHEARDDQFLEEILRQISGTVSAGVASDFERVVADKRVTWTYQPAVDLAGAMTMARAFEAALQAHTDMQRKPWLLAVYERIAPEKQIRNGRCFDDIACYLNEHHRDWNMNFHAFYHTAFDPFADPEIIPAESAEIRLALGKLKRSPVWFDIVHDASGSFIEARSTSRRSLQKVAKSAELEWEYWTAAPWQRWQTT